MILNDCLKGFACKFLQQDRRVNMTLEYNGRPTRWKFDYERVVKDRYYANGRDCLVGNIYETGSFNASVVVFVLLVVFLVWQENNNNKSKACFCYFPPNNLLMPLWLPLPGWWRPNGAGYPCSTHHEPGDPLHPPVRLRLGRLPQPHQVHLHSQVPGGQIHFWNTIRRILESFVTLLAHLKIGNHLGSQ